MRGIEKARGTSLTTRSDKALRKLLLVCFQGRRESSFRPFRNKEPHAPSEKGGDARI